MTLRAIQLSRGTAALLPLCLLLSGCFLTKKPRIILTSEPSIERAFDILESTSEGGRLVNFIRKNPVTFEYSTMPGACYKFYLKSGMIYMPKEYKNSDTLLALTLARAAYIYRLYTISGLEEVISEEEELGALYQARFRLEIGLVNGELKSDRSVGKLQSDFCTYLMEGTKSTVLAARTAALSPHPECQRPLETLQAQRVWLEKIREAIDGESFYQLLYERDMQKVHKGVMPVNEAMKNDAAIRALPMYEIYRYQRSFYDKQSDIFTRLEKIYREAIKQDEAWRRDNQATLDKAREEFSACNLPE